MIYIQTFIGTVALATTMVASSVQSASFDCNKAAAPDEIAVCKDRGLSDLDVKMATIYDIVQKLVAMGTRGDLQDQQRAFLADRAACGADDACIRKLYDARISVLQTQIDRIAKGGPY